MLKKLVILMIAVLGLAIGACSQAEEKKQEVKDTQDKSKKANIAQVVTEEWQKSAHAKAVGADKPDESPALREEGNCFKCHNGYAFETKAEKLPGSGMLKGASCDTCHTGYGQEVMASGSVEIPLGKISGGKGALCMACHMGRGKKPDQKSAPHYSVQTDMVLSKSGAELQGYNYASSPHKGGADSCLSCHMAEDKNGIRDHGFKMTEADAGKTCGGCHSFKNFNPEAKADYDGSGTKAGIRDEVGGLAKLVEKAILEKLNGGKFVPGGGKIEFQDAQGKVLAAPPSPEVYNAAWNYLFVKADGSQGIHNPGYAVQLLQQSYKSLTGKDVPKAEIRK